MKPMSEGVSIPIRALTPHTFEKRLQEIRSRSGIPEDVWMSVHRILREVRARGDEAVRDFVERFDGVALSPDRLRVDAEAVRAAYDKVPREAIAALRLVRAAEPAPPCRWCAHSQPISPDSECRMLHPRRAGCLSQHGTDERRARALGRSRTHRALLATFAGNR
jgi:hypothetical protein